MQATRIAIVSASLVGALLVSNHAHANGPTLVDLPQPAAPLPAQAPDPAPITIGASPASPASPAAPVSTPAPAPPPAPPPAAPQQSVRLMYESTQTGPTAPADRPAANEGKHWAQDDSKLLHGFRLGYAHVMNYDVKSDNLGGVSLKEKLNLKSPNHFLLGYEIVYRVVSHSWLNVVLIGNAMIAGMEQSKFLPTANMLIGAELANSFQMGVGANLSPLKGNEAHTIVAAGWTPRVGSLYTPLHVFFIPDVEGAHRMGVTVGVTF